MGTRTELRRVEVEESVVIHFCDRCRKESIGTGDYTHRHPRPSGWAVVFPPVTEPKGPRVLCGECFAEIFP